MKRIAAKRWWIRFTLALVITLWMSVSLAAGMSLSQAVSKVRRDTGGKILSAQTVTKGQGKVHRIKVLTPKGRVRVVEIRVQ